MSTLDPATAIAGLGEKIVHALRDATGREQHVVRVEVPVGATDPSAWLAAQRPGRRSYWSDRDRAIALAGVGSAMTLALNEQIGLQDLFSRIRSLLADSSTDTRFFGGLRFDGTRPIAEHWRTFGPGQFILPRFELVARGDTAVLAANLVLPDDQGRADEILFALRQITCDRPRPGTGQHSIRSRIDNPRRELWLAQVQEAIDSIGRGEIDKVVLARESQFDLEQPVDPIALIAALQAASPHCYVFCFEPADQTAFIGASPEQLYRRDGRLVRSEALAGTRPRGADDDEDRHLGEKLMNSRKEAREHAFVANAVRHVLAERCRSLRGGDERSLVRLARVQHLITRFEGQLNDRTTDADLIEGLHPTPAVGGVPTHTARAKIRDLETFDRGWYAGPIGWVSRDSAEFAVGIRSALVGRDTLRLFSGAGIVEGSHPDKEWDEIENKISGFLKLIATT